MLDALLPGSQLVTAAALALLAVACRLVIPSYLAAALAVAPMVLLIPWRVPVAVADSSVVFPLSASLVLLCWLLAEMPLRKNSPFRFVHWMLLAFAATFVAAFSPQVLVLLLVVVLHRAARHGFPSALRLAAAVLVIPAAWQAFTLALPAYDQGSLLDASWWLDTTIARGWDMRPWFQSAGGVPYKNVQSDLHMLFYLPLLLPFAAAAGQCRSRWWFAPMFLWAASLVAGNLLFARNLYIQLSLTMQMALLIPFTAAAIDRLRNLRPPDSPASALNTPPPGL